jgi:hypothetical protein
MIFLAAKKGEVKRNPNRSAKGFDVDSKSKSSHQSTLMRLSPFLFFHNAAVFRSTATIEPSNFRLDERGF